MSISNNFKSLLTDFFSLYHPRQVKKVDLIAEEFQGQEVAVLKALCEKYKKPYSVIPGLKEALETPAPAPVIEENTTPETENLETTSEASEIDPEKEEDVEVDSEASNEEEEQEEEEEEEK